MPDPIYTSDRGLYPHQAEGIAQWMVRQSMLCTWEAGTGKSHMALAGGSMLFEDRKIGLMLVICEANKVMEWQEDFEKFTTLRTVVYHGTPAKREAIRKQISRGDLDAPQVLISTYETSRNDIGKMVTVKPPKGKKGRGKKEFQEGPLVKVLTHVTRKRGVAIAYDESTRLGNRYQAAHRSPSGWIPQRGSMVYRAHQHLVKALRKVAKHRLWIVGMTATPIDRNPETVFNQAYLIDPEAAGTISRWEKDYVRWTDQFGRAKFKNITEDDISREPWVTPFSKLIAPMVHHKRKSDPDVRAAFPAHTEEPMYVELAKAHREFYAAVEGLKNDREMFPRGMSERDEQVMFGVLRQAAAHPMALVRSPSAKTRGTIAHAVVQAVGPDTLKAMASAKSEALIAKLTHLVKEQGSQAVVFTFFGQSVLPLLYDELTKAGFTVTQYHGQMSGKEKDKSRQDFRAGQYEIFLSSNAGAQGLNLPEAQYVVHFEMCLSYAKTLQRCERISRIGSGHPSITSFSMVAMGTVEEAILRMNFRGQAWHEGLIADTSTPADEGDDASLDTATRRALFRGAKEAAA